MLAANWEGSKTMKTNDLILEIQSLPVEERARVADSVLRSLHQTTSEVDQKWASLATKRLQDIRTGNVKPVTGDAVFHEIWHRFR
jgi:Putative addiction module component